MYVHIENGDFGETPADDVSFDGMTETAVSCPTPAKVENNMFYYQLDNGCKGDGARLYVLDCDMDY